MRPSENEPNPYRDYALLGVDGEREPQLNSTVVGRRSGYHSCYFDSDAGDAGDASDSDGMESE